MSVESRRKMSESHKGKPRPYLKKDPLKVLLSRSVLQGECRIWVGAKFKGTGYGQIQYKGGPKRTHRLIWELVNGPIPTGLFICHSCDNPSCINLDHLFLGTHKQNMDDMRTKGRENFPKGERVGVAKMTERNVITARRLWATGQYTVADLCRKFGITHMPMTSLLNRKTWKHI